MHGMCSALAIRVSVVVFLKALLFVYIIHIEIELYVWDAYRKLVKWILIYLFTFAR